MRSYARRYCTSYLYIYYTLYYYRRLYAERMEGEWINVTGRRVTSPRVLQGLLLIAKIGRLGTAGVPVYVRSRILFLRLPGKTIRNDPLLHKFRSIPSFLPHRPC